MNTVLGQAAALGTADEPLDEADLTTIRDRITAPAEELLSITEKARALDRLARQDRDPERIQLAPLVGAVAADAAEAHPEATVTCTGCEGLAVCTGRELTDAVAELVENAAVHGGPAPTIEIDAVRDGDWVGLTVTDDGPGIEPVESRVIATGAETAVDHGDGLGLWLTNWKDPP
jgi:signal transduction histidine kinase